jgi:hypothetical protein
MIVPEKSSTSQECADEICENSDGDEEFQGGSHY